MARSILRSLSLLMLLALVSTASAQQRLVLLETFTNSCDLCTANNTFDDEFKHTISSNSTKIIHLNHHIANVCDPMAQYGGANGSNQTAAALSGGNFIFMTAVDRVDFAGATGRTSTSQSEWEGAVTTELAKPISASLSLVDATYDKTTNTLHAIVTVTAAKAIPNPVAIHYAITQDNVSYAQCNGSGPAKHDNVVRYVTVADSAALPALSTTGQSVTVEYTQTIHLNSSIDLKQLKLIGFLIGKGGNVVNAAVLKKNFDTLQAPTQSLTIIDSSVDSKIYHPGDLAVLQYASSNVPYVDAYYSLDNGGTWNGFTTSVSSPINWTVPDSATTQGKFKLVGPDGTLEAVQSGDFSIVANPHFLTLLHPTVDDTAHNLLTFVIQWRKVGIDSVKLEYTVDGGGNWTTIAESVTDTFYNWTVPNIKTSQAQIRITPLGVSDVPSVTSPQFTLTGGLDVALKSVPAFHITSLYPSPASPTSALTVTLAGASSAVTVEVLDLLGNQVSHVSGYASGEGSLRLPLSKLAAGTYIVRVTDGVHADSRRIVIE